MFFGLILKIFCYFRGESFPCVHPLLTLTRIWAHIWGLYKYKCTPSISQAVNSVECVFLCCTILHVGHGWEMTHTHTPTSRDKSAVCLLRAGHWSSAAVLNGMENGRGGGLPLWKLLLHVHYTKVSVRIKFQASSFLHINMTANRDVGKVNAVQQRRKKDGSIIPNIIYDLACVFINCR